MAALEFPVRCGTHTEAASAMCGSVERLTGWPRDRYIRLGTLSICDARC